jgi:L-lysine 2,3-aminomutase
VEKAKARPCADCGNQYAPWKMDFDHTSGKKVMRVSQLVRQKKSIRLILAEIAKCEVVCALCHRDRTHFRRMAQKGAQ